MKALKRILSITVLAAIFMTTFVFAIPFEASADYDNTYTFTIAGTNTTPPSNSYSNVYLYTNTTGSTKTISWDTYNFRYSKLMIFNSSGRVIECGGNITSATDPITGAPQLYLYIPAGGFMVAFNESNTNFMKIYNVVMEGAMLYNSTMSVIYEAYASHSGNTLTVQYNNPKPVSANAKKFLFIGNSTTYFNGTPIKFKAMAQAAGIEVDVTYCTRGSAYLSYFLDPTRNGTGSNGDHYKALNNALAAKKYDYVVLQDAAGADYYTTKPSVEKLLPLIEANGAEAVLYMRYSAASTFEQIRTNAIKHHNNYATIAKDFGLVCAPAADAFVHCAEKYPSIGLYASDGGHHSKEGSYLIAATWLYSYLGVNPVGNTYTADMSATTVARLQECAKLACEEGYPYPGMENDYAEDGVYYKNIALKKPYTVNGKVYIGTQTDADANGNPLGKYTDGTISTSGSDAANACWKGNSIDITIDLKGNYLIKNVRTDMYGDTWGIPDPVGYEVRASVSQDGVNFTDIGAATMSDETVNGEWKFREFNLKTGNDTTIAKYIRITYINKDTTNTNTFFWSSEIRVYGAESVNIANKDNLALNKSYSTSGIYTVNGVANYPDENGTSMTNGKVAASAGSYSDTEFAGFNATTEEYKANGYAAITVDLGAKYDLNKFVAHFGSSYDKNGPAGIYAPTKMTVCVSDNGSGWTEAGSVTIADNSSTNCMSATLSLNESVNGRYVQYRFVANKNWIMIAEVEAYGTSSGTVTPDPVGPTASPTNSSANVAYGKDYTHSSLYVVDGSIAYPDEDGKSFTDGYIAPNDAGFDDVAFAGFNKNSDDYKVGNYAYITVDLGKSYDLNKFIAYVASSYNIVAGISAPSKMTVCVSDDNTNWKEAGSVTPTDSETVGCIAVTLSLTEAVKGRYIQFRFEGNSNWIMVAEVEAFGTSAGGDDDGIILGDVNNDKKVDSVDYLLVKRSCFNTYTLSDDEIVRANVDKSERIDSVDYVLIKRIVFGTYTAQ